MVEILVPYHQDERLPTDDLPLPGDPVVVDVDLPAGDDVWRRLVAVLDGAARHVAEHARAGGVPAVVSGDCLVAVGVLAGLQRAGLDPAVVWFDAHGDVHTLQTSTSGYLGGMSLRLALGAHPERLAGPLGLRPLPEHRAVLVDARDLDPAEGDYLAGSGLVHRGVEDVVGALPPGPLLVHVDVDVIDGDEVPGLRFPVPAGPSRAAVLDVLGRIVATGRVAGLHVACPWYPATGADETATRSRLLGELVAGQTWPENWAIRDSSAAR